MDSLFDEGGPHNIRRLSENKYQFNVSIPLDEDGMRGSECPDESCAPRYFKVKPGTGVIGGDGTVYCPYCRTQGTTQDFITEAQKEYALRVLKNETLRGVHRVLGSALGLDFTGSKTIGGGGLLSIKLSLPRPRLVTPSRPKEEELRREMCCPACTLQHAVYGFAVWCPDCAADIFLCHVAAEWEAVRFALAAVEKRREEHGARVAANDLENALEDTVSIFEAALKVTVRRFLLAKGETEEAVLELLERKVRNGFQNIARAEELFREITGVELLDGESPSEVAHAKVIFEKRHAITHNRGVADARFVAKTGLDVRGREVSTGAGEVERALAFARRVVARVYARLFPDAVSEAAGKGD